MISLSLSKALSSSLVVVYDISDARKRRQLFKLLKQYGMALQESVFFCELESRKQQQCLLEALNKVPLQDTERIHCFSVNRAQAEALSPSTLTSPSWIIE